MDMNHDHIPPCSNQNPHPGHCPRTGRPLKPADPRRATHLAWLLKLGGIASLIWFLIRVIPKPSRAAYPCQRAAAPAAAGFVLWALGSIGSVTLFKKARGLMRDARYRVAALCLLAGLVVAGVAFLSMPLHLAQASFTPTEPPNTPMGVARGIYPGRVVWAHRPEATTWNGTTGNWWADANTSQTAVSQMLSQSLRKLAGAPTDSAAWDKLFKSFNQRHGNTASYQPGEKVVIKLNLNQCHAHDDCANASYIAPQLALALARELVQQAGVAPGDITFYDSIRQVPSTIYNRCKAEFPALHFVDWSGGDGREQYVRDTSKPIHWSTAIPRKDGIGNPAFLPTCVTQAKYLINVAGFKGHTLAGVTLTAKNHFGSFCTDLDGQPTQGAPQGAGIHTYIAAKNFDANNGPTWIFPQRPMGTYNALVDLMGHPDLGEKTLLFMIDGLYATKHNEYRLDASCKWQSAPFNGNWTASLFLAQDGVAIDSVALDFLRNEPTLSEVYGTVDNYLHEAAQANAPPSHTTYAPGGTTTLPSLGAHEHWNNPIQKQYSRNLGTGPGIELVTAAPDWSGTKSEWLEAR